MSQPTLSIITPIYNSAHLLPAYFDSLLQSDYQDFEVVLNDELRSTDDTPSVVEKYRKAGLVITYLKENKSMAQGRKRAVEDSKGRILFHMDSDMQVTPGLLGESVHLIDNGLGALIIPEEAFGTTFWAKCKWLEKKCYEGVDQIEALRIMPREVYDKVGGHNVAMVFSEDKDLDLRIRAAGYRVGRTTNFLHHNEGALKLSRSIRKKLFYSTTANLFETTHPDIFRYRANPFNRYKLFLRNGKYFFSHPLIYVGLFYMITVEFGLGGARFVYLKLTKPKKIKVLA